MKKIVIIILVLGLLVRFWNFQNWWGFDYDQEINAGIAKSIIVDHKPILIGPETSVGGMYVGPYFNYIIALSFALGKMNPMTTILLNVILSASTLVAFYLITRKLFNPKVAIVGLIFYAFSFVIGGYDRVLWNPTPIPLISLLFLYFLCRNRIVLAALFLGIMFHLHFQAILLATIFGIYLLLFNHKAIFNLKNIFGIAVVVFIFFTPLVLFDVRHNFLNSSHLVQFFFGNSGATKNFGLFQFWQITKVLFSFFRDLIYNGDFGLIQLAALVLPIGTMFHAVKNFKNNFYKVFIVSFFIAFFAFVFYKGPLPTPYYFLFLYPLFIIALSDWLSCKKMILLIPLLIVFSMWNSLQLLNLSNTLSLRNKHNAVKYIIQRAGNKSFKIDMVTYTGLNTGYKYLFWLEGKNPSFNNTAKTERSFKMVIPASIAKKGELNATFGAIGVVELSQ